MFKLAELSFELFEDLRPLVEAIRKRDRSLADQLMRAASSIALNVAEGQKSDGGNMKARFFTAAGSASETRAALRVAVARRHIQPESAAKAQGGCIRLSPSCGSSRTGNPLCDVRMSTSSYSSAHAVPCSATASVSVAAAAAAAGAVTAR